MTKKHIYQIGVDCTLEAEQRVKMFCRFTDQSVSQFTAVALDNEIDYQLAQMTEIKRKALEGLLNG